MFLTNKQTLAPSFSVYMTVHLSQTKWNTSKHSKIRSKSCQNVSAEKC